MLEAFLVWPVVCTVLLSGAWCLVLMLYSLRLIVVGSFIGLDVRLAGSLAPPIDNPHLLLIDSGVWDRRYKHDQNQEIWFSIVL